MSFCSCCPFYRSRAGLAHGRPFDGYVSCGDDLRQLGVLLEKRERDFYFCAGLRVLAA